MEERMSVQQVLRLCSDQLGSIRLPVSMHDEIGSVISGAIRNITMCVDALDAAAQEPDESKEQEG